MTWTDRRASRWLVPLAACAVMGLAPGRAHAQFGYGGFGWMGGFNYVEQPTNVINQAALSRAGRPVGPEIRSVYANMPNSYINNIRDNGFVPTYNVARRRPVSERAPARTSPGDLAMVTPGTPAPVAAPAAPARPQIPLSSFFDSMQRLAWPAESPVDGDLKEKREVSDHASLEVYLQSTAHGAATLTSVAEARQKLLDYGRPALKEVREKFTPRVADTFHMFMLSLYDSLAQVATVADPGPDGPPPVP
ncbi:hypothetical protein OJF2_43210 [Aquisphaera giovannonii]|uniref:DUF4142 domain-containing protein n=1 Tax=Aquisphaera giovannonii TaxID=406548 RepID=A0A5B9W6B6_9BACT|nr:hypothetical protein [Aquisphaera giovannonii]QEH35764.1 hypothetical protein OJF2_43210 [Aquisphaera giovannonii]